MCILTDHQPLVVTDHSLFGRIKLQKKVKGGPFYPPRTSLKTINCYFLFLFLQVSTRPTIVSFFHYTRHLEDKILLCQKIFVKRVAIYSAYLAELVRFRGHFTLPLLSHIAIAAYLAIIVYLAIATYSAFLDVTAHLAIVAYYLAIAAYLASPEKRLLII